MKTDIHPKYFSKAKAQCTCGAVFEYGNTVELTKVEVCSNCHPFYTGKKRLLDTSGRVDSFMAKMKKAQDIKTKKSQTKKKKPDVIEKLEQIEKEQEEAAE